MKKILIILGSYFPKPSPNGICVQQVAHKLRDKGIDVTIIATKSRGLSELEIIEDIKVHRVKGRWFHRAIEWCEENSKKYYINILRKIILLLNKIQNILFIPTWPFLSPLYLYRLYRKAMELHRLYKYDGVISVYNPIDALITGVLLKKKYRDIKLMLYFLDALSGGIVPKYFNRKWLEKRGWFWESKFFNVADSIFVMESHREHYINEKYKSFIKKMNVVDIPIFRKISLEASEYQLSFDKTKINLIYTGTLLKHLKNPSYFLTLFRKIADSNYVFHIFGGGDCYDIIMKCKEEIANDSIVLHGHVNVKCVYNALLEADILINIGSLVDCQIPCKIFEYIAVGKPIISFYKTEGEPSIPYLEKYPLVLLIKEDWEKIDENALKVRRFIDQTRGKTVEYDEVEKFFRNNTPEPIVNSILNIIDEHYY